MHKIYVGVDPGKAGFVTVFNPQEETGSQFEFFEMPTHKVDTGEVLKNGKPKMKSEFYPPGLIHLANKLKVTYAGAQFICTIEEVTGRQGWSAQNNFTFGHTAGLQTLFLMMLNSNVESVRPQKWQTVMYKGIEKQMIPSSTGKTMVHDTKATSAIVAQKMAPDVDFRKTVKSTKIDDNKTDSFLICVYGWTRDHS